MRNAKPEKCKHGRDPASCCACHYGDIEHSAALQDRQRDLTEELKTPIRYKLIKAWNMIRGWEKE